MGAPSVTVALDEMLPDTPTEKGLEMAAEASPSWVNVTRLLGFPRVAHRQVASGTLRGTQKTRQAYAEPADDEAGTRDWKRVLGARVATRRGEAGRRHGD